MSGLVKRTILVFCLGFACISSAYAGGLRFNVLNSYLDETEDGDPWLTGGYLTTENNFDLNLTNEFNNKDATNVKLVLSMPDSTLIGSWQVLIQGFDPLSFSSFSLSGNHPELGHNSLFQSAKWTELCLGDLARNATRTFNIQVVTGVPEGFLLHFDAYGDPNVKVPFSHDLTFHAVPEPLSYTLVALGFATLAIGQYRKGRSKNNLPA